MRKPIDQKSPLAAWATLARDEAGMSVEEVVDALAARGHSVKAATIRGIEGGSKGASARLRRLLAEVYGTKPPGDTSAPTSELSELAASIRALAQAIQEERAERLEWERGVLESVSSLARWLGQRDDPAPAPLAGARRVGR